MHFKNNCIWLKIYFCIYTYILYIFTHIHIFLPALPKEEWSTVIYALTNSLIIRSPEPSWSEIWLYWGVLIDNLGHMYIWKTELTHSCRAEPRSNVLVAFVGLYYLYFASGKSSCTALENWADFPAVSLILPYCIIFPAWNSSKTDWHW